MIHSASKLAAMDIAKYIKEQPVIYIKECKHDVWYCCNSHLFTHEQKMLNKQLGIHKVNKFGEKMNRYSKK